MKFQKIGEHNLPTPSRKTAHSAGYDLATVVDCHLAPGAIELIPTGFAVQIPNGHVGFLAIRSGTAKSGLMLMNGVGVIDADYRGEVMVMVVNSRPYRIQIRAGERIAQLVVCPVVVSEPALGELDDTERGDGGFGSTGK